MADVTRHFASSSAFATYLVNTPPARQERGDGFTASRLVTQGIHTLTHGDLSNLSRAQDLLDSFNESIEVPTLTPTLSIAGGFPDVPAYLTGQPEHMWTLTPQLSERTPLRIFVGLTSSAAVPHDQLVTRGCTLAAFAMALSSRRPVYITPYVNLGVISYRRTYSARDNALISWDISTSPLVLSELMGCLSDPHVTRHVGLAACYRLNPNANGGWHSDYDNEAAMRKHLNAQPADLYLPSIHLYDPLVMQPLEWIRTNLAKYADTQEQGAY